MVQAAHAGHEAIVQLLQERNDPNLVSIFSAVISAGNGGHEAIIRLLLQWKDANLSSASPAGMR